MKFLLLNDCEINLVEMSLSLKKHDKNARGRNRRFRKLNIHYFLAFMSIFFIQFISDGKAYQYQAHDECYDKNLIYENSRTNPFEIVNEWKYLDYEYPSYVQRQQAIVNRQFIPENNLPLGIDVYKNRIFVTSPRWKDGVPASLSSLPYPPTEISPALRPYPNWESHGDPYNPDCSKLISVYRTAIDECSRLWLIDAGIVNATVNLRQICPPKIVAYDLQTNELLVNYQFPLEQVKEESLHSNIVIDVRNGQCHNSFAYVTDVWRFGIVVYSLSVNRSWRVTNFNFSPNPTASNFNIYGLNFQWLDGVFGMSLSPPPFENTERTLYFHPMGSYKEFAVSTTLLQDESLWPAKAQDLANYFIEIGDRGQLGQSSTSGFDRNGIMFFTQVHKDNIGCWDMSKPYTRANLALLLPQSGNGLKDGQNNTGSIIQFPNDLKVDREHQQGVWVMSNRLPIYLYSQLNYSEINFRILRANVDEAVAGTICEKTCKPKNKILTAVVPEGQCF